MITHRMLLAGAALALSLPSAAFAQIELYQESFSAPADGPMSDLGWVGHISRGGSNPFYGQVIPHNDGGEASPSYPGAYIAAGAPSAPGDPAGVNGFMLFVGGYTQLVAWTDTVSLAIDPYETLTFSWSSRNHNGTATMQPIIRIGETWYVTNDAESRLDGGVWGDHVIEATKSASDWQVLNFDGTTTDDASGLANFGGIPVADLGGTIDAIGMLFHNVDLGGDLTATLDSGNMRVDNYAVAVPEPSTYALLGGIAVLGFAQLRRRKAKAA